jgi:hypothetical protein
MKRGFFWQLGYLIPRLIVLAILADGACRFLPLSAIAFRGWEALYEPSADTGLFRPNGCYCNSKSYGDLAALSNRPWLRQYRHEVFTTDALGCRNCPDQGSAGPPEVLLVGSSFSVGTGVADPETLASQLQALLGQRIYNAAGFRLDVPRIRHMAWLLGMRRGLVIAECPERAVIPHEPSGAESVWERGPYQHWLTLVKRELAASQLRVLAQRAYKRFQNDCILPNPYAATATPLTLRNGATMLFLPEDLAIRQQQRPVDHAATYFSWLAAELRRDNLDLLLVLVPDKCAVYGPLLQEPDAVTEDADPYLDRLETAVRPTGIPVVNLLPVFRRRAGDLLDRGEYLYWRDDTHWNATGISVAAGEIARACKLTR